jgi:hypothetical protein
MARNEANREDLIREAVALPERVELQVPGFEEPITIGFRATSAMSVFIGQDPVYQFDPEGRLRRAYVAGFLYRSEQTTLARLQRVRTESETRLLRHDLDSDQLGEFRHEMTNILTSLAASVRSRDAGVLRAVPSDLDHLPRIDAAFELFFQADPWLSPQIRR